jgi:hypothetical protein
MTNTTTTTTHLTPYPNAGPFVREPPCDIIDGEDESVPVGVRACTRLQAYMITEQRTMTKQTKTMGTTSTKRTVYASKGAAAVGPGKEDVVGAINKYCEDANKAKTARRWWW